LKDDMYMVCMSAQIIEMMIHELFLDQVQNKPVQH